MQTRRVLTLFTLTMINIAAIGSVKNWPLTAEYGLASVSYLILAALVFFLPLALVTAELATTWPENGGIYAWIKQAFGHRTAFLAIWLFWFLNVLWYPTLLSFVTVSIAYLVDPALAANPLFTLGVMIGCFWLATLANLMGMTLSGRISSLGAVCGTFVPGILIIALGIAWWISDRPSEISFTLSALIPDLSSIDQIVFFVGILLSLSGLEMSAIHAKDVQHPQKNYPKAIVLSGLIIIGLSILGVLAIASVVPQKELSLVAGSLQAFSSFVETYHLSWLTPIICLFMIAGAFGSLSSWVIATSRGLLAAAQDGDLPAYFRARNHKGMPARLLIAQAILVSVLSFVFILMPSVSQAFWVLSALLTQLYLIIYIILFSAAIKLRYAQPHQLRPYKIPGGKIGIWGCGLLGIASSLFAIGIGFVPPAQFASSANPWIYASTMGGGILLACIAPSVILFFQRPQR